MVAEAGWAVPTAQAAQADAPGAEAKVPEGQGGQAAAAADGPKRPAGQGSQAVDVSLA